MRTFVHNVNARFLSLVSLLKNLICHTAITRGDKFFKT